MLPKLSSLLAILVLIATAGRASAPGAAASPTVDEAVAIATDAYIYGYPLVTMDVTRRVMTNVAEPQPPHAPMGQFAHNRSYPTAAYRELTAPNADTLYSTAWLDLSREPYILSIPQMWGRYFLLPMLDGWTNVFQSPGKRTSGTMPHKVAITGPGWKGALPADVKEYKSPTNMVWIVGRIYCTGTPQDFKAAHVLQNKIILTPLSAFGQPYAPPAGTPDASVDMQTPVRDQVNAMDVSTYFNRMAALMRENPPAAADAPAIALMAKIGIVPGQPFDAGQLGPEIARALQDVPKLAFEKIRGQAKQISVTENGWKVITKSGAYGTDYLQRALVAAFNLGANWPEDTLYPASSVDANGDPYDGAGSKYTIHFEKGQLPPANAFWSLTMYDAGLLFVPNRLNRYALSSRDNFKYNRDGSVDLYIQNTSPGPARESNWLPAPDGKFILMMRLYWPRQEPPSIMDGTWKLPPVKKM